MSDAAWRTSIAARGWATRAGKKLSLLIRADNAGLTVIELNNHIEQFDRRLNAVNEAQSAAERELDVALLEADIDEAPYFRDRVHEAVFRPPQGLLQ